MAQKWIINDGKIICGYVKYHKDLISSNMRYNKTSGGGSWSFDRQKDGNTCYFYGMSEEFGQCTKEEFESALVRSKFDSMPEGTKKVFSTRLHFEDVVEELKSE